MNIVIIIIAAGVASIITLFSGFGLGTMLTPVFALIFPIEIAVALTGVVHFFNNIFKLGLLGKHAQWSVVLQFGVPSVLGAFFGAKLLLSLTVFEPIAQYEIFGIIHFIAPLKLIIAVLMIYFAFAEMFPKLQSFQPSKKSLPAGGLLSGFFGGLSGHQGALRSAFLIRYELGKEQFLATGIVIACFVDITRLSLYSTQFLASNAMQHWEIVAAAVVSAFGGAYAGNRLLKKVTLALVQKIVAGLLLGIALALGSGLI
ncbi:MAG: sulfite exporter TauE/SafE family protein [Ignavibacteriales bacterium]|nr:sulfite exporter TauE/SafE family protein [Ignavibacteriales bacterium]